MQGRVTGMVQAEDFPPELAAALSLHPVHGSRYRVTVEEVEVTDEEKLAAGLGIDGDTVFAELRAEFFPDNVVK